MEDQKSQASWSALIKLSAEQSAGLLLLGYSYYENGRNKEAREIFEGVQVIDPENPYPPAILGSISQREGKLEEAIAHYTSALRMNPRDIQMLVNRGECFVTIGKFPEAAVDLRSAIEMDPEQKHPAANRARLVAALTLEGLILAEEKGIGAVQEAKKQIDEQLKL